MKSNLYSYLLSLIDFLNSNKSMVNMYALVI